MSAFKLSLGEIKQNIHAAQLNEATQALLGLQPTARNEIRERDHLHGIILMRQGSYTQAIDLFLKTLQHQGPHVALVIDLATCYYLTGQIQNWLRMADLAEFEFRQAEHLLSWERKVDFRLIMGKFREEQGAFSEALTLHEANLKFCEPRAMDEMGRIETIRSLTQILRLQSQYGMSEKTHELYLRLIHHSVRDTDWDCAFEVEHALMIFEARHFGMEQGLLRLRKLSENPLFSTQEASLMYTDICYEALFSGQKVPGEILSRFRNLQNLSPYEHWILKLSQGVVPTELEMLDWPEMMSPSAHLRLLVLMIQKSEKPEDTKKKYVFLLQGLSAKSKKIWLAWIGEGRSLEVSEVTYCSDRQVLLYQEDILDLSKKAAFREMVELLMETPQIDIYSAIEKLWQGDTAEHQISRLRMRIRRCNDEIEKAWGVSSFLFMTESQLRCSFQIRSFK